MCSRIGRSWNLLAAGPDLMVLALAIATRPRWTLVLGNLAACALFVMLRPPASPDYIADVAAARAESAFVINSGISGMVACRLLYPWSRWHGGEALGVKVLEVANAPAVAVTVAGALVGELGLARQFSVCGWSWLLAGVFVTTSSVQWWMVGAAAEHVMRRIRRP